MKMRAGAEINTRGFNGAVTTNSCKYIVYKGITQYCVSGAEDDGVMFPISTAEEQHSQDDLHSFFNNAAYRERTPICLGSLFALYVLQTIEPANLLLKFTVFVNRVIEREQREREGESANRKNIKYRGSFISCVST